MRGGMRPFQDERAAVLERYHEHRSAGYETLDVGYAGLEACRPQGAANPDHIGSGFALHRSRVLPVGRRQMDSEDAPTDQVVT
jgi:hypothetical protein